jgi:ABC-type branched-subunit amino acid transport system substrate-binding protein
MNLFSRLFMIGILLFVGACTQKPIPTPVAPSVPGDTASEDVLWTRAETLFQSKAYDRALAAYRAFMIRFPDSGHADTALMKIGTAGRLSGNIEAACRAYNRLTAEYPDSLFLADASIEVLTCLYGEGRFSDVVEQAADLREQMTFPEQKARLEMLLGDTYGAMEDPVEAFYYYAAAFEHTPDTTGQAIADKLKQTALQLETTAIRTLLYRLKSDALARGYLLYQMGLRQIADKNENAALTAFSELTQRFPGHEYATDATLLIEKIKHASGYQPGRVGCLLPLTGPYKSYGQRALRGIELAVSMTGGTPNDTPPHLIIKDSGSDPEKAIAGVKELVKAGVAAIIGPMAMADIASRQAQLSQVPIIVFSQKNKITEIGDYVLRNFLTSQMQVKALAAYAFDRLDIKKVAILYPKEKYGSTFMQLFWDEVLAHGGQVVGVEAYDPSQTDFADAVKKLAGLYYEPSDPLKEELEQYALIVEAKDRMAGLPENMREMTVPEDGINNTKTDEEIDEKPQAIVDFDAVFIPDAPNTAGLVIPQLAFYDITDVYLLGTNLWHSQHLIKIAGEFLRGVAVMPDGFYEQRDSDAVRQFSQAFQKAFKTSPGFIEAVAYDTARMVFGALGHCQVCLKNDMRARLLTISGFNGVTGLTAFDQTGEAVRNPFLLTVKGHRFVELDAGEKN